MGSTKQPVRKDRPSLGHRMFLHHHYPAPRRLGAEYDYHDLNHRLYLQRQLDEAATTIASAWRGAVARRQRADKSQQLCDAVARVQDDVQRLWSERGPDTWEPAKADLAHRCLQEMLMQHLLKLDGLRVRGSTAARQLRKACVQQITRKIETSEQALAAHLETSVGGSDIDSESDAAASDSEAWSLAARPARASSDI